MQKYIYIYIFFLCVEQREIKHITLLPQKKEKERRRVVKTRTVRWKQNK